MTQEIFIVSLKDFIILGTTGYNCKKKSIVGVSVFILMYIYIHVGIDIKRIIFFYNEV